MMIGLSFLPSQLTWGCPRRPPWKVSHSALHPFFPSITARLPGTRLWAGLGGEPPGRRWKGPRFLLSLPAADPYRGRPAVRKPSLPMWARTGSDTKEENFLRRPQPQGTDLAPQGRDRGTALGIPASPRKVPGGVDVAAEGSSRRTDSWNRALVGFTGFLSSESARTHLSLSMCALVSTYRAR